MNIVLTIIVLVAAVVGFMYMPAYQATLFLLFWIVAYPVALSFTRAKPLQGQNLIDIYKAGLSQVPVVGKLFAAYFAKTPPPASTNPADTPPTTPTPG